MDTPLVSQAFTFDNGLRAYLYVEDHFISFDGYVGNSSGWSGLSLLGLNRDEVLSLIEIVKSLPIHTTYEELKTAMYKVRK